jgi:hypothetical protein
LTEDDVDVVRRLETMFGLRGLTAVVRVAMGDDRKKA